jgi:SsrA-binding protein
MSKKSKASATPVIENRKARHDYQVLETLETGIVLCGTEVKAIRDAKLHFTDSWIEVSDRDELWWNGGRIDEFSHGNQFNHVPVRKRKLLANRHEILKLGRQVELKGYTLVPLKLYFVKGWAKLQIGLCKGKDGSDKRQTLVERTHQREMDRSLKGGRLR